MNEQGHFSFLGALREIRALYTAKTHEVAVIRAAHLNGILRLTPYMMSANIISGLLVFWSFSAALPLGLWFWGGALGLVSALALRGWWRHRGRVDETASTRAAHRATLHAGILAAVWAVMLLIWFPAATTAQQLLIATLLTGMLSAGAYVLSGLPLASLIYVLIYSIGGLGAIWRVEDPMLAAMSALICLYAITVTAGSLFSWRQATILLKSQAEAIRQERMLAILLEDFEQHAGDAFWETDSAGRLSHLSARLSEMLAMGEVEFQTGSFIQVLAGRGVVGVEDLRAAMASGRSFRDLQISLSVVGTPYHFAVSAKPLMNSDAQPIGWRGVLTDVTDKVVGLRMLQHLAHEDSLTGLSNRFTFRDVLTEVAEAGTAASLFIIDLDHFKTINDTLGHAAGDDLLKAVAKRLVESVSKGDIVARLGGDEFAVLSLSDPGIDEAAALAKRIIVALTRPTDVQGRQLRVGASIGVTFCERGLGVEALLIQADTALYAAKAAGRGRHAVFTAALGDQSRRRATLEAGLRDAIERNQLALHWQPKMNISDGRLVGAEGLLRWQHPDLGAVSPGEFIPIAEQCGLIEQLGEWALRDACRASQGPLQGLILAVNVSPLQLRDGQFSLRVRDALQEFGMDPAHLELEITETAFMDDADGAIEQMHTLRRLGVRMALDDFGVGYSSLAYLRRFPFDTLKIDRAFVMEAVDQDDARAIIEMIAKLAATLKMQTVCEGVETAEQLAVVTAAGCNEVQGYLVARPRPLAEFVAFRKDWPAKASLVA